jgi:UDP-N-acetylmuramyl pentapeptide phosphotransferase/UDP-N-acetylglucosamine-1-phosphate transferase
MRSLALGAVLALVWLLFGSPLVTVTVMLPVLVEPVTIAFAAGLLTRPYVRRSRRWTV